ncbi:MAG TPA: hypothetical protein VFB21_05980 [Chthonomonadaceae bacterium]|nr:hypothetical protein [Chthonomonadaceae bacterium]
MALKVWRFFPLLFTALLLGLTFSHVMEMPAKMQYPASLYLTLHRTLYLTYGTWPGILVQFGAIIATIVLAFLVRSRRPAFGLTLLAAFCLVVEFFGVWVPIIAPANAEMKRWAVEAAPANWIRWRNQWEYAHAARFVLDLIALSALVISVLRETPEAVSAQAATSRPEPQEKAA